MIKMTGAAAAGAAILGLPAMAQDNSSTPNRRRKVLVIGAHPDDPETGCGGTICLLTDAGHDVTCVYLTRGEAGIPGTDGDEAARIRSQECANACEITGAKHIFMTQVDGQTEVTLDRYKEMRELLEREKPDVVLTHWPIDSHRDHAACGLLVLDAWRRLDRVFDLYYFEVMTGTQTQMFHPTHWVDISAVLDRKHEACFCHVSQNLKPVYDGWHTPMELFRGIESRCHAAEAFAKHTTALATMV